MDFAEAEYISRLRSGVKGHFSYREIAWEMKAKMEEVGAGTGPADRGDAALGGRSAEAVRGGGEVAEEGAISLQWSGRFLPQLRP